MSTSAPISADEFQALEQKVLRAVEIVKREREARATAEAEVASLQQQLAEGRAELERQQAEHTAEREAAAALLDQHSSTSHAQLSALQEEREQVRQRVEKMLQQMDELL